MYKDHLTELFHWIIKADTIHQDVTSQTLHLGGKGTAHIVSKQAGIIAGIEEVVSLIDSTSLQVMQTIPDGSPIPSGQHIMSLSGENTQLLAYERVLVNILGRMSGIATHTHDMKMMMPNDTPIIAATRKTPWMLLDKKAVAIGGGLTHRLHLADWAMIKDNHVKILQKKLGKSIEATIEEAVKRMLHAHTDFFEIEVATAAQATTAIKTFAREQAQKNTTMAILLDNFTPTTAKQTVATLKKNSLANTIIIEASGNITGKTLPSWAKTNVDILSLGSLTHSSTTLDISMSYTNSR